MKKNSPRITMWSISSRFYRVPIHVSSSPFRKIIFNKRKDFPGFSERIPQGSEEARF
jgi:hypothetical protein